MQCTTDTPEVATATKHSQQALLLESTEMNANIVFLYIDWKSTRMHRQRKPNMKHLSKTIASVVHHMDPTMICMVEVGEATQPLTEEQMQAVATESERVWSNTATEHVQLRSMFTTGAPYMTIYRDGPIHCRDHRILYNLYQTHGLARTAQTFVCSFPGGESIDVVNVHAPSGKHRLTNPQRQTLLTNLLQSNSLARPGCTIGKAHFVIGGNMHTGSTQMAELLQVCRTNGSLETPTRTHEPTVPKHGDLCIVGGCQAITLMTTAENHDALHDPYGICWSMSERSATEQPWSFRPAPRPVPERPVAAPVLQTYYSAATTHIADQADAEDYYDTMD